MSATITIQPEAIQQVKTKYLAKLDASKLEITPSQILKPTPSVDDLVFGKHTTDHMVYVEFHPESGWSAPQIKPYAPLILDPASSCFQYCPSVFEGMKAYLGPDRKPRLFRPELNMKRMERSVDRVALPPFDGAELLKIIQRFVSVESRWIPDAPGCSLYLRPTIIGTRPALGVAASDHAALYVLASPTGPMFRAPRPIALLGWHEHARAWPGGTGEYKLGLNYAPGFLPQRRAAERGYDQVLWLLDEGLDVAGQEDKCRVTEAGAMNFFVVLARDDGDLDVITPPLDGTILPGLTRASCLELASAHSSTSALPGLAPTLNLHVSERKMTMADLRLWHASGVLREAFCVGTAVIVAPVGRIGFTGAQDIILPEQPKEVSSIGLGPVGAALRKQIDDIQNGRVEWEGWCVACQ